MELLLLSGSPRFLWIRYFFFLKRISHYTFIILYSLLISYFTLDIQTNHYHYSISDCYIFFSSENYFSWQYFKITEWITPSSKCLGPWDLPQLIQLKPSILGPEPVRWRYFSSISLLFLSFHSCNFTTLQLTGHFQFIYIFICVSFLQQFSLFEFMYIRQKMIEYFIFFPVSSVK